MARPSREQGKLSCESSLQTLGGIAVATVRPLPGRCADIAPDFLPDVARPSRDRLAGLRAVFGELLASRKKLVLTRGKASISKKWLSMICGRTVLETLLHWIFRVS
jgi:hypothetical protein